MNERRRLFKRIFIAVIYLAVFSGLGTGVYFLVRPTPTPPAPIPPTIYPIEIIWSQPFISGLGIYSAGAKIRNPNNNFGAGFFSYTFYLYDANDDLLIAQPGESFIWPGESKYLILGGMNLTKIPARTILRINNPTWQEVKVFKGIDLSVGNVSYQKEKAGSGKFFSINFTAANDTSYDLNKVFISAIVFDNENKPIAVNSTVLDDLKSKEHRQYSLPWFSAFSGNPGRVDLSISTNLWENPELLNR